MNNSSEVIKLIKKLREEKGLTVEELAKRVGIAKSTLSRYENGQRSFPINDIGKYADVLDTSIEELLNLPTSKGSVVAESTVPYKAASKEIPLYGSIAAGMPLEMIQVKEYVEIPLQISNKYPDAFLLVVNGDSMNRIVPDNSYALIVPTKGVNNGEVVAVNVNGYEATLKRLYTLNNTIVLEPDSYNPEHRPQTFDCTKNECEEILVIGRMVWFMAPPDIKI